MSQCLQYPDIGYQADIRTHNYTGETHTNKISTNPNRLSGQEQFTLFKTISIDTIYKDDPKTT